MTYHVCDLPECGERREDPLQISVTGYWPHRASGIMMPEHFKHREFCSHACFVKWMRWAVNKEAGVTSVMQQHVMIP